MAGLYDIGIKVHGSRNVRNAGESAALVWGVSAGCMGEWMSAGAGAPILPPTTTFLLLCRLLSRPAVKCVFKAFDQIRTEEDFADEAQAAGKLVAKMPPGRYRNLRI